jgi:hypothetical protein
MKKFIFTILFLMVICQGMIGYGHSSLRWFASLDDLTTWCASHQLPIHLIASENGTIDLINPVPDPAYDCDDYAKEMMAQAATDGYFLPMCPVVNGKVYQTQVSTLPLNHVGNWTCVGNAAYYVEPWPPDFHIVFIIYFD